MIRSMTGYGRAEVKTGIGAFTIEVRSVNNRYLDIQIKTVRMFAGIEHRIRKAVQERFSRGRFDLFIGRNGGGEGLGGLVLNKERAGQYIDILRDIKHGFGLPGEIDLQLVAVAPDVITVSEPKDDIEALWRILSGGLSQALAELDRMRSEEGDALARDIMARLDIIEKTAETISAIAPRSIESAKKRISDAVAGLSGIQPDPARLAQEIAFLAERTDITEELTRLESHLAQFRAMLSGAGREPVGRKLDFLLQEIMRETNTVASKAMNADVSLGVVEIKAEIEKIREQVQNIE